MRILVLCDAGNNRSVVIAHQLKYWGHDVLPAGLETNSTATLRLLCNWADRIIITEGGQASAVSDVYNSKVQLWDVSPDTYPRPFNKELLRKVRALMEQHKAEYKN